MNVKEQRTLLEKEYTLTFDELRKKLNIKEPTVSYVGTLDMITNNPKVIIKTRAVEV